MTDGLARGHGVALWRQIQQAVEHDIADGRFMPGDQLPTEFELAKRFDVNRHTVRRALAALESRGAIRVEQGRGTFVQENVVRYKVGRRTRFTENVAGLARTARRTLLTAEDVPCDRTAALALGLRPGVRIVRFDGLGEVDGRPISIATHHLPKSRFEGIVDVYQRLGSLTEAYREFGINDYERRSTRVSARIPTSHDADLLNQPRSRPVLVAESINVDADGNIIEFCITRFNSDWVQLVFEP